MSCFDVVERIAIDRGQILLDRGVEPIEHGVHTRGFDDPLAVAAIERIERSAQHRLKHVDHAQGFACGTGEGDAGGSRAPTSRDRSAATDRGCRPAPAGDAPALGRTISKKARTATPAEY